ncbi:hypothetical protein PR202_ga29355 [Eleusine coracana subsp. coracana]|uniref:Protein SHORT-ROOT 1 n=1 Tax=Eleusine coracana subsp. coracana TaxID=191504 RepID=A0AAV5DLF1_ELECO|nr:hypothetical protein QOZ80_7AG0574970 [Eleusine coracana subsp. coracana]GJN11182.1 hypothetical protein PR202_ga29355 [Eleusine coracana subsp. coracana]
MDTLFRLVSLHASSSEQQQQPPQQQSPSYNSRSTTSSGSRSSSHQTNASYNYYTSSGGGGGQYSYYGHQQQPYYLEPYQEECHHLYMDEDFSSSSSSRHHHLHSSHGGSGGGATPPTSSAAATTPLSTTSSTAAAHHHQHALFEPADLSYPPDLNLDFSSPAPSSSSGGGTGGGGGGASSVVGAGGGGRWGSQLLLECARAVAGRDSSRVQQLMWMLNELASPYGDLDQKLASYFLQGLFARLTSSGPRTLRTLAAASDRNASFDSTRRTALRFQELSPWSSFGHVAANGAILESFLEAAAAASSSSEQQPARLHILDLSNTFCTQWPTLLEALATRSADDTPHLSITTIVQHHHHQAGSVSSQQQRVMREIGQRMERFARLMGVPFTFRAVHHAGDLADLDLDALIRDHHAGAGPTTALAVNCVNALRGVAGGTRRRDAFVASLRRLDPRVVTVVEEEADLVVDSSSESDPEDQAGFLKVFGEGLRFFAAYMDSLEESFPRTSNERLALERGAGRAIVDLVACPASESVERRETAAAWARRMRGAGFAPVAFSEDVADDVRSLLRRYREGWSMREADDSSAGGAGAGVFLAWKEQPLVWASAWRP